MNRLTSAQPLQAPLEGAYFCQLQTDGTAVSHAIPQ